MARKKENKEKIQRPISDVRTSKPLNNATDIERYAANVNPLSLFGSSALTFVDKISPVRGVMSVRHATQRVVLCDPEPALMSTGAENVFGDRSSWNIIAKDNYRFLKRFKKFKDSPISVEACFFEDLKTHKIVCHIIKPAVNLIEKYGFRMNNKIKNFVENDIIPKGTPITQSTSYDDHGNYCAGVNVRTALTILPELTEDGITISDWLCDRLKYHMVDMVKVDLKSDAFLLNRYGDANTYKPFPDIGETIKDGIVCAIRENSFVSSFQEASISHINDREIYSEGVVVDIDICSNVDVDNEQLNHYLRQIKEWYSDIYAYISTIVTDPYQNDTTLLDIYHKAEKYLNSATWVVKEKIVDTMIEFTVLQTKRIRPGQKIVGRYGNKSVVTRILPRDEMPYTDDGKPIDMIANALAVPNRIIGFSTYELSATFKSTRMWEHLKQLHASGESKDNIINMATEFIELFNENEANEVRRLYAEDPEMVYDDIINNGIYLQIPPLNKESMRDALLACDVKWPDVMKRYKVYTNLEHRRIELKDEFVIGYQYTWVLKQEPSKAMSVVSTGRTTPYDLPVKNHQYNNNLKKFSDNPIKFGEYDTYNFLAGAGVREFTKFTSYYRGSQYTDNSMLMSHLSGKPLDLNKYNKFPPLSNLKNALKLIGAELTPNKFGYNSTGLVDKIYEVYINNNLIHISIPTLGYTLMMHSYYLQYEQYLSGAVDLNDFFNHIRETNLFCDKPDEYINEVFDTFIQLLPKLQELKQYS